MICSQFFHRQVRNISVGSVQIAIKGKNFSPAVCDKKINELATTSALPAASHFRTLSMTVLALTGVSISQPANHDPNTQPYAKGDGD